MPLSPPPQATCNQARSLQPVEIIELSCVMLEAVSGKAVAEFQSYVSACKQRLQQCAGHTTDYTAYAAYAHKPPCRAAPRRD